MDLFWLNKRDSLLTSYAPSSKTVALIVGIGTWAHARAIQVQTVRIASKDGGRGPIEAAATPTAS